VLSKTCWKGVFRVNKDGELNVNWGEYKRPKICDSSNLRKISSLLRYFNPKIQCANYKDDYKELLLKAEAKDFIYFDPPYDSDKNKKSFTEYTPEGFGPKDQKRLASVFRELSDRGCFVLESNADTSRIRELYSDFTIKEIDARNLDGSKRKELLIFNYLVFDENVGTQITEYITEDSDPSPFETDDTNETGISHHHQETQQQEPLEISQPSGPPVTKIEKSSKSATSSEQSNETARRIFDDLYNTAKQLDPFIEVAISQEKFQDELVSNGISRNDVPRIINDMNLEEVCIEGKGWAYRRKCDN
jgi:hypothetical protein